VAEQATKHVRIAGDLADLLGWVVFVEGGTAAEELDPIIRPIITERFAVIRPAVARLMKMQKKRAEQTVSPELGGSD
jgi:hypothetical protein